MVSDGGLDRAKSGPMHLSLPARVSLLLPPVFTVRTSNSLTQKNNVISCVETRDIPIDDDRLSSGNEATDPFSGSPPEDVRGESRDKTTKRRSLRT